MSEKRDLLSVKVLTNKSKKTQTLEYGDEKYKLNPERYLIITEDYWPIFYKRYSDQIIVKDSSSGEMTFDTHSAYVDLERGTVVEYENVTREDVIHD